VLHQHAIVCSGRLFIWSGRSDRWSGNTVGMAEKIHHTVGIEGFFGPEPPSEFSTNLQPI